MKVEVLFPELCNIYAEIDNIKYLEKCSENIKITYTSINEEPLFTKEDVDMLYLGSMPHIHQDIILKKLKPHTKRIKELIEKNKIVLFTGDAIELVGDYIQDEDTNKKTECLKLFDVYFERNFFGKYNFFYLGEYNNIKMVGSIETFSKMKGNNKYPFIKTIKSMYDEPEGINYKNFYATYLIGPLLLLNPLFTKLILKKLGQKEKLYLEEDIINAYEKRLKQLESDDCKIIMDEHG